MNREECAAFEERIVQSLAKVDMEKFIIHISVIFVSVRETGAKFHPFPEGVPTAFVEYCKDLDEKKIRDFFRSVKEVEDYTTTVFRIISKVIQAKNYRLK